MQRQLLQTCHSGRFITLFLQSFFSPQVSPSKKTQQNRRQGSENLKQLSDRRTPETGRHGHPPGSSAHRT